MVIKESSDELNPTVVTPDAPLPRPRGAHSPKDYLALAIGTCGVGYLPLAPGTWGSLVGITIYVLVRGLLLATLFDVALEFKLNTFHLFYAIIALEMLIVFLIALAGIWAASRIEGMSDKKDPSKVVIDEVVGQYIALIAVPFPLEPAWWSAILAFVLFRFFDIVKPFPARKLESLHGGLGIMLDDVVAGVYALIGVMLAVSIRWFFSGGEYGG